MGPWPFLTYEGEHEGGVVVVHGHTPRDEVEPRANRLGIDMRAASSAATGLSREGCQRIKETLGLTDEHFKALRQPYDDPRRTASKRGIASSRMRGGRGVDPVRS